MLNNWHQYFQNTENVWIDAVMASSSEIFLFLQQAMDERLKTVFEKHYIWWMHGIVLCSSLNGIQDFSKRITLGR